MPEHLRSILERTGLISPEGEQGAPMTLYSWTCPVCGTKQHQLVPAGERAPVCIDWRCKAPMLKAPR